MVRCVLGLALLLNASLAAQSFEIQVEPVRDKERLYWHIRGQSDAAEQTLLLVRLLFEEAELAKSRLQTTVRQGKFLVVYGPIDGKVLSGEYCLEITPVRQGPPEKHKKTFYIGSPHQEKIERLAWRDFLRRISEQYREWQRELHEDSEAWVMKNSLSAAEKQALSAWIERLIERHVRLKQEILSHSSPEVLVPYSKASMDDLGRMCDWCNRLLRLRIAQLTQHHDLPVPGDCRNLVAEEVIAYRKTLLQLEELRKKKDFFRSREFLQGTEKLDRLLPASRQFEEEVSYLERSVAKSLNQVVAREPMESDMQEVEAARQARKQVQTVLTQMIARSQKLYDELESVEKNLEQSASRDVTMNDTIDRLSVRLAKLRSETQALRQDASCSRFFPGLAPRLVVAVHNLYLACQEYKDRPNQPAEKFARARQHRYYAIKMIWQLESEIK